MSFAGANVTEIAIVGAPRAADTQALLDQVRSHYRPFAVTAVRTAETSEIPLLQDRPMRDGRATAYVCRNFACRTPVTEPADLAAQLASTT
jgi:uncharacterized protein YyaL (SSP411 family)